MVAKAILFALNVAVGVLSIGLLVFGIWALTSDYGANEISALITTDLFIAACVLVIVAGVGLFLLSSLGVVAVLKESKVLLLVYFSLMGVFLLLIIAGMTAGFVFMDQIEDKLADNMRESLTTQYGVNLTINDNEDVTVVWNDIQKEFKCCGVRGSLNSTESWYLWQSSSWFTEVGIGIETRDITNWLFVPSSCCSTDFPFDMCQGYNPGNNQPPKEDLNEVVVENPALYHDGCLDKLEDRIWEYIIAITVVAAVVLAVFIMCILLALCLLCSGTGKRMKVV